MGNLRVNRLEIRDFMRVEGMVVEVNGGHVKISGKNGQGKSSVVDAIWCALGGGEARRIEKPVRAGAEEACVSLDLGEYVVEKRWNGAGARLVVRAADGRGAPVKSPQQLLDGLLGRFSLDPVRFLEGREKDRVDEIMAICGIEPPVSAVKKLTGEDHGAKSGEGADEYLMRLSADDTGEYFIRRRMAHRKMLDHEAQLKDAEAVLVKLGGRVEDGQERTGGEMAEEMMELQAAAERRRDAMEEARKADGEHRAGKDKLEGLRRERDGKIARMEDIKRQIAALEKSLEETRVEKDGLEARIEKGKAVVAGLMDRARALEKDAQAIPDVSERMGEVGKALMDVEEWNACLVKRGHQAEQVDRLADGLGQARADWERLDKALTALRDLRRHLCDGVDLGVKGLAVVDGRLMIGGVPFEQGSHAERLAVACAVAMKQAPALRLLRVDDGEHLDGESRDLLLRLANENGFQVFYTVVSDEVDLRVEVVDGGDRTDRGDRADRGERDTETRRGETGRGKAQRETALAGAEF